VLSLFLQAAWKVLLYSLLLGAGLPIVYAVGVRALAIGGRRAEIVGPAGVRRHPLGVGLTYVVASGQGKMLSFDHVYPTLVPKG
jgi:hypothetical protein